LKILAIIITYNRSNLLLRCIKFLNNQARIPDDIIVINNGSTDNTESCLIENNINFITQDNTGSAGGWFTGINYALKNNFDAVWMMDDDGYPERNALSILEKYLLQDNNVCCSSMVVDYNNINNLIFPLPIFNINNFPKIIGFKRKIYTLDELKKCTSDLIYPYAQLFNGALISTKAITKIGNINKNYFIFGEETDYFYRLKKVGNVISVNNALHFHPNVKNRTYSNTKVFYYIKNSFINNSKHMDHSFFRNIMVMIIIIYRCLMRNGIFFVLSLLMGPNSKYFYPAIWKGIKKESSFHIHE
jgi:rhamnopyranosyl-N-acetylglucosaminyl-diphospho-decaprenol beta-1,3/1,4-galactofuranosyltransferase